MAEEKPRTKRRTETSAFGVSKREGHDSSKFYARFEAPQILESEDVNPKDNPDVAKVLDHILEGDSRDMSAIPDNCCALVTTSPPYFSNKAYEEEMGKGHIPASYLEYLEMLRDVFAECWRVLEPGGRIAINVANLGRKPFRSLSADVVHILQDELGFLLRGEIIWIKADGANGNCAWGSFASAQNPTLRDVTERIIVASKGRFSRAIPRDKRQELGMPFENTIAKTDFMAWTLDTWRIQPESAKRVGHPAPFPVELPRRLIELYTYKGDVVLDPFAGAASHALAAIRSERHYIGFEAERQYVELAQKRIEAERSLQETAVLLEHETVKSSEEPKPA